MEKGTADIVFFVLIFVAIGIAWLVSTDSDQTSTGFLSALVPVSSTSTSTNSTIQNPPTSNGSGGAQTGNTETGSTPQTPVNNVTIDHSWSYPKATTADSEYISISANYKNTVPVSLAGWKIQSAVSGISYAIPLGVRVPIAGQLGTPENVVLKPGERLIISTGRSPIGQSFLENKCTGYFGQFQNFYPSLGASCPIPSDELPYSIESGRVYGDACFDYLRSMNQCTVATTGSIPTTLPQMCQQFIATRMTYNGCVSAHRNDSDFFKSTWRLYLNRADEIWRDRREEIDLVNANGAIVDSYSY